MRQLRGGLDPSAYTILRARQDELREALPQPTLKWVIGDPVPEADLSGVDLRVRDLNELRDATIILREDKCRRNGHRVRIWQTHPEAWDRLQAMAEESVGGQRLPCGCPADRPSLHNPRDKEGVECRRHGIVMETDAVREVLST